MLGLHSLVVPLWAPVVARRPALAARLLAGFARAELGSMYTLRWAAAATPSMERRARYLGHAGDEARHAAMFHRRAEELNGPLGPLAADAEDLYANLGERRFLAFLEYAEGRAHREFEHYARAFARRGDQRTAALLRGIMADEFRHEEMARDLLEQEANPAGARRYVRVWEAGREALRRGRSLAEYVYLAMMFLLYPLLAPLALWERRRRRALRAR
ncbi:MAG: ferritin-like domain-containing protein [Myxococcota bacterium]